MYAREKSDRVIVPVNQPNKEDPYSAEVGEGRTRTEENVTGTPHDPDSERDVSVTQDSAACGTWCVPPFIRGRSRMR